MYIDVLLSFYKRADNGYAPHFMIFEHNGANIREIPFDCVEIAQSKEEAIRIARAHALKKLKEKYPSITQIRFREK